MAEDDLSHASRMIWKPVLPDERLKPPGRSIKFKPTEEDLMPLTGIDLYMKQYKNLWQEHRKVVDMRHQLNGQLSCKSDTSSPLPSFISSHSTWEDMPSGVCLYDQSVPLETDDSLTEEISNEGSGEVDISPEMKKFLEKSAKHRKERDRLKKEKAEKEKREKEVEHIMLEGRRFDSRRATTEAPSERPGSMRAAEMKELYGEKAAMIHGMETAMQLTFDRIHDLQQPKLWPALPLNIQFQD